MVLTQQALGRWGTGLVVDGGESGWTSNRETAEDDPTTGVTARELARMGRRVDYTLTNKDPRALPSERQARPYSVTTEVELFRYEARLIRRHERGSLDRGLSHEQVVEGVPVMQFVVAQPRQRGVGIEQELQRAPNGSAISSGSSSKSSAMRTRPRHAPRATHGGQMKSCWEAEPGARRACRCRR